MFNQLFPQRIDNTYPGHKLALWLFGLIVLIKTAMGVNSIFFGHKIATSADGIPLDTFPLAAAGTIIAMFAIWGLAHLMICLLCVLVLFRYRAMVPLMFAFLLLEHLSRKLVLYFIPIARSGTPPGTYVNLTLVAVMVLGLALSLSGKKDLQPTP
ncbi:MAG TPA: hypothetical protein VLA83_04400 [Candidatus Binatia bacterium]|nr:hypothetical protein [Candidatus Binatia bacterium]